MSPLSAAGDSRGAALTRLGLVPAPDSEVLVAGDREPLGAISFAPQPFESEILGRAAARVDGIAAAGDDEDVYVRLIEGCLDALRGRGVSLVSCRLAEDRRAAIGALEGAGFGVIERLLIFRTARLKAAPVADVGLMDPDEADACAAIAGDVFTHDRFHADPRIDDGAADRLKTAWVLNDCRGRADAVLVARDGAEVIGFNACLLRDRTAVIDLIGVAAKAQGRGIGKALVTGALAHYAGRADEMIVGTQASNTASVALYEGSGFRLRDAAVTLHAHL